MYQECGGGGEGEKGWGWGKVLCNVLCNVQRFFFYNQDFYTLRHESLITHAQLLQELERLKTTKSVHAHKKK